MWLLVLAAIAVAEPLAGQKVITGTIQTGHITGTVTGVHNETLSGATVVLEGPFLRAPRTLVSDDNGFFDFNDLVSGTYRVSITAKGFATWTSPTVVVTSGQYVILTGCKLKIEEALTTVSVTYSVEQVATEQVKMEQQQRVFGIVPNFYVVYDHNAVPLTTKLKFQLALRTSIDPVNILGSAALAGINQAGDVPNYGQGLKGYGKRFGAGIADDFSDIMIGGAILPSLLHQDPRYFYQGTGTNKSRALHALSSPFVCKGDNGHLQPNYSSIGGDIASSALSNAYYPASNRGVRLVFENLLIGSGERMLGGLLQEFILPRFTHRARKQQSRTMP
jgi:hypothetical protein